MEHRNSASSKDNGGLFTGLLQLYGRGSVTARNGCFSSANCLPQSQPVCHKTESSSAFLPDLSTYMDSFPGEDSSNQVFPFEASTRMGHQHEAPPPPRMPSEILLDAISLAQRRLQHLEVIVRMMIQGRGQPQMAQQHHSLWMEFTSIMSQLSAATAVFSSPLSFQASSPLAPLANDTFDFGFDGFNDDDYNKSLGEGSVLPCPSTSGMDTMLSGACQSIGLSVPSWTMNIRATPAEPAASSDEVANIFTTMHAQGDREKSTMEKGNPVDPPEIDNQRLIFTEEQKEDDDDGEGESLPPGTYELVELAATEILAEHTHFCEICGKGFKRDANLRMHMRGHGDEYKTAAALARPDKLPRDSSVMKLRRYSCPYAGCKRNKKHPKFLPLKTMLCVKNHYRRSHCPKVLICSRCKAKKFSVIADLKTHEKHCGQDKWQCSCGTTFSRKDKLYGHIGLFAGHTPATPAHESDRGGNPGGGMEGFTSSCGNVPGMPANVTQDNTETKYIDGKDEMGIYKMSLMATRTHESGKGSFREQSLNEREKGTTSCVSKGALLNDSSFQLSASTAMESNGSDFDNLLSDGLFCQARCTD